MYFGCDFMAYTIVLDAGHGGSDPGAVYNGRQEKDDSLRLAMAVGNILQQSGYNVVYTRTTDEYNTPFEKATIGNNNNADLFVSIHRNSGPTPDRYSGIQTLVYDDNGIKAELARNINRNLIDLGFEDKGVVERPNLVVLKRTKMPAVLVEAGFINSSTDNEIFDRQFDEVARAIADGIMETVGEQGAATGEEYYKVQVGAYRNKMLADDLANRLQMMGFPATVNYVNDLYKVWVGNFARLDNAVMMERMLKEAGFNTFITK